MRQLSLIVRHVVPNLAVVVQCVVRVARQDGDVTLRPGRGVDLAGGVTVMPVGGVEVGRGVI